MIDYKINAKNYNKLMSILLRNAGGASGNMQSITKMVAGEMMDAVEENFEQEGRPKWKPLSPRAKRHREEAGYTPIKILQASRHLATSINPRWTKNESFVGTNVKYAAIHQFGGRAKYPSWGNPYMPNKPMGEWRPIRIPARPFLKLTKQDIENIQYLINKKLIKGAK